MADNSELREDYLNHKRTVKRVKIVILLLALLAIYFLGVGSNPFFERIRSKIGCSVPTASPSAMPAPSPTQAASGGEGGSR